MKTVINIKADKGVKERAQKIAEELGLSLSAVVNASLKQFVRNREVYFSAAPRMSSGLEALLGSVEKDIHARKNISRPFKTSREVVAHLEAS